MLEDALLLARPLQLIASPLPLLAQGSWPIRGLPRPHASPACLNLSWPGVAWAGSGPAPPPLSRDSEELLANAAGPADLTL